MALKPTKPMLAKAVLICASLEGVSSDAAPTTMVRRPKPVTLAIDSVVRNWSSVRLKPELTMNRVPLGMLIWCRSASPFLTSMVPMLRKSLLINTTVSATSAKSNTKRSSPVKPAESTLS